MRSETELLESDIEARVGKYAADNSVIVRKFVSPNQRSVPDRIYVFPNGQIVFIEFKKHDGKLTPGQTREINKLIMQGQLVYVINNTWLGRALVDSFLDTEKSSKTRRLPLLSTESHRPRGTT